MHVGRSGLFVVDIGQPTDHARASACRVRNPTDIIRTHTLGTRILLDELEGMGSLSQRNRRAFGQLELCPSVCCYPQGPDVLHKL